MSSKRHFVLVHGAGIGAWCWYKVATRLKSAVHQVTSPNLGGASMKSEGPDSIQTIPYFVRPLRELMASLPRDKKVILVGHSYGGFCISLAMESFPEKIEVAAYVAAFMPMPKTPPGLLLQEFIREGKLEVLMNENQDARQYDDYMTEKMYQNCLPENLELEKMSRGPARTFMEDLADEYLITVERFGSVKRVFVVCGEDKAVDVDFQRRMIDRSPPKAVKLIEEANHMAMLSKPQDLCQCFEDIVQNRY